MSPNAARRAALARLAAGSPYGALTFDPGELPAPAGTRTIILPDEGGAAPAADLWATARVRHLERERTSLSNETFLVSAEVEIVIHAALGIGSHVSDVAAYALIIALDADTGPPARDGLTFRGASSRELALGDADAWRRTMVVGPFTYEDKTNGQA